MSTSGTDNSMETESSMDTDTTDTTDTTDITDTTDDGPPVFAVGAPPRAGLRQWLGLAVLMLAVLLISVDATVLDVAVPFISEDLAPSSAQLLWIIDAYGFVLAALLVTMGTLGDRIGRRRLLLIGATGFGAASVLAAFSTAPAMLISARVLQGVAGATLMPATLASIRSMFLDSRQRATAIGVWGAMWGGGAAAGPLVGGWLLEHFAWGSVFLVNVPVLVVLVVTAPFVVPESRDPRPGRFDPVSAALSAVALLGVVAAVKEGVVHGPSWPILAAAVVGLAAGWLFVRRQVTSADPLIDLRLFGRPLLATAVLVNLLSVFALAGVLYFGSQYLQLVLELSPLWAGVLMLPGTVAMVIGSLLSGTVGRRWGPGRALAGPLLVAGAGAATMLALPAEGSVLPYVVGFTLVGLGAGIALTLTSALVVEAVEPERAGAASAVSETSYELGGALGVAVLGTLTTAVYRATVDTTGLADGSAAAVRDTLGGAVVVSKDLPAPLGADVLGSAQQAFVAGAHAAAAVTAVLMVLTAVLAAARLRHLR